MYPAVKPSVGAGDSRDAQKHTFGKAVSEAPSFRAAQVENCLGKGGGMGRAGSGSDGRRVKPEGAEREESPLRLVRYRSLFGSNSPRNYLPCSSFSPSSEISFACFLHFFFRHLYQSPSDSYFGPYVIRGGRSVSGLCQDAGMLVRMFPHVLCREKTHFAQGPPPSPSNPPREFTNPRNLE